MKVVRLYAYLMDNVGDDMMVETLLKRYPNVRFYFDNKGNPSLGARFNCYPNYLSPTSLFYKWRHINQFFNIITFYRKRDFFNRKALKLFERRIVCSVYIGGSLYQQSSGVTVEREEKKFQNGPLFVIGANFGPYHDEQFFHDFHNYFQRCAHVCFRDQKSYHLFSDLKNTSWAPDVVFNMNKGAPAIRGNKVLISVVGSMMGRETNSNIQAYVNFIIRCCCSAVRQGHSPVLVSFCKHEGDEQMIDMVMHSLPPYVREKTDTYLYGTTEKILSLFVESCFVIATRFHAMILALIYQIPFFCVAYNEKINNVLNDLGINSWSSLNDLPAIDVDQFWTNIPVIPDIAQYKAQAHYQFEALDCFLR